MVSKYPPLSPIISNIHIAQIPKKNRFISLNIPNMVGN